MAQPPLNRPDATAQARAAHTKAAALVADSAASLASVDAEVAALRRADIADDRLISQRLADRDELSRRHTKVRANERAARAKLRQTIELGRPRRAAEFVSLPGNFPIVFLPMRI